MRRLSCFLFMPLWVNLVTAQTYFEGLFGAVPSGEGIGETIQVDGGYLSWCYSYGNFQSYMFIVDEYGELQFEKYIEKPDSLRYLGSYVFQLSDTCFIGMTLRQNLNQPSNERGDYCLIRFGLSGNVLSEWVYGESDHIDIPQHLMQTTDGGFLCSGQTQFDAPPDTDGQLYAVKIDSIGNVEWEKEYGGGLYDSGGGGIQTPDGGFFLLGWTRSYGAGQRDFYLVKTDAQGNEQWRETYGTNREEIGKSIILLSDGKYLLTGSGSHPSGSGSVGILYKVSLTGNELWSETYAYTGNTSHDFYKTLELPNGNLVSVGATGAGGSAGWLVKTDSLGEVIWQREYDKNPNTDLFSNVLATDDGGFLLSGQAINEATNSQDAWLLKVDSIGCPYPNCTVGIEEEEKTVMVDVWPNPATDVLNIEKQDFSASLEMTVLDVNGREILRFTQNTTRQVVDVSTWPIGIYILRGTDNAGRGFSLKVAKQ